MDAENFDLYLSFSLFVFVFVFLPSFILILIFMEKMSVDGNSHNRFSKLSQVPCFAIFKGMFAMSPIQITAFIILIFQRTDMLRLPS